MEKYRSKKFCILLYPEEDLSHKKALETIKLNYDCAYITHSKDKNETGENKKNHTHVVISLSNAKWNTALAKEINLPINYIQRCRSLENALEYLIHFNDDSKYQYSINEVKGNLKHKLEKIIINDNKSEEDKASELIEFIYNTKGYIRVYEFARYCVSVGKWDVFRRSSSIYLNLIKEHNNIWIKKPWNDEQGAEHSYRSDERIFYELDDKEFEQLFMDL